MGAEESCLQGCSDISLVLIHQSFRRTFCLQVQRRTFCPSVQNPESRHGWFLRNVGKFLQDPKIMKVEALSHAMV